jgi:hypothetical protein
MKTEEALFKSHSQSLLFEALKNKKHVLHVFLHGATVDSNVVEVDGCELV